MMHPKYERLRMLGEALQAAASELDDPIERLEVIGLTVRVWSRRGSITLGYRYADSYAADGSAIPGGGAWSVTPAPSRPDRPAGGFWARLLRR